MKIGIELLQHVFPAALTGLDLVELLFHVGGEFHADDIGEPVHHQAVDDLAELGRRELFIGLDDIFAVLDGGDDGGVGRRTADALLLHRTHERSFGIAGRRLGKVLLLVEACGRERFAGGQVRQRRVELFLLVVAAFLIDGGKAGEFHALVRGAENMPAAGGLDGRHVVQGVCHLRGDEAAPDELVEPELLLGQIVLDHLRIQRDVRRADGLVRVLRAGFRLVAARLAAGVGVAIAAADDAAGSGQRLLRDAQRVGTHVGDKAHGALAGDLHALVELLRDHHRAARGHVELPRSLLLEGRGDEGRRGRALLFGFFDARDRERAGLQLVQNGLHILFAGKLALLRVAVVVGRKAAGLADAAEIHIQRPVFLRLEGTDLVFPVDDQARGDRLHAAGRQTLADLPPQQRAELIADDPVEHAAGLLRIDQVLVDGTRMLDGFLHDTARDLVEGHAVGRIVRDGQQIFQVPGDGLAFAVRVRCEIDAVGVLCGLLQLRDDLFLALERIVFRLKVMLDIDAQRALRQIAQVAHAGLDLIVGTEIFSDGFGLRRRFHDDQILFCVRHRRLHVIFSPARNISPAAA